jgi:carbonic anhydrase/acetyltransferase-like protein (isoleucine patch superfamily)
MFFLSSRFFSKHTFENSKFVFINPINNNYRRQKQRKQRQQRHFLIFPFDTIKGERFLSTESTTTDSETSLDPVIVEHYKKILKTALSSIQQPLDSILLNSTTSSVVDRTNGEDSNRSSNTNRQHPPPPPPNSISDEPQKIESLATLLARKVAASVLASQTVTKKEEDQSKESKKLSLTGLLTNKEIEELHKSLPTIEQSRLWYTPSRIILESLSKCFVHPSVNLIGEVQFGKHCSFFPNVVIRADVNSISIGSCTNIKDNCVIHVSSALPCKIGDNVTVGHQVCLHACTIESNVLIGMGTTIMDGALVRQNSIVGAGSLITSNQEFPEMSLILGRPAKVLRPLTEPEKHAIIKSAEKYALLKDLHMKALFSSKRTT